MNIRWLNSTALLTLLLLWVSSVTADLLVEDLTLVGKTRVGRTDYEYHYIVTARNRGNTILNVSAVVTSQSPTTVVLDGDITFPDLRDGESAASIDTITIRQDRRGRFNQNVLDFQWSFENSPTEIMSLDFVELGGRPDHEGLLPIPGQPATRTSVLEAVIAETPPSLSFHYITETGVDLGVINMSRDSSPYLPDGFPSAMEMSESERVGITSFYGQLELPGRPFRIQLRGAYDNGEPIEITYPKLFNLKDLKASFDNTSIIFLPAGETTTISLNVTNFGVADLFNIVVIDDQNFVSQVLPSVLALEQGESGSVEVSIMVPSDTTPTILPVSLDATITSQSDATRNNDASAVFLARRVTP